MSRNGSGVFTKVNTFASGNPITAASHNANWDDIANEITNSVAADGQTSMTGPLKATSGTAAAPSHTFSSDTDTGAYRVGSDNYGIAVGGTKIVDVSATGVDITGAINSSGPVKQGGSLLLPIGAMLPYAGSTAPALYLLCDGSSKLRASYPDLFAAIGTTYGAADGTHFNVPDLAGRVPAGKEASASRLTSTYFGGNSANLGAVGGAESHTLTAGQIPSITSANAAQAISVSSGGVTLIYTTSGSLIDQGIIGGSGTRVGNNTSQASANVISTGNNSISVTSNNTGGNPHNNVQPTIICNYIIFAGV
jgi:microcystin-dependent protein